MKTANKVISILLCAFMLATSVINDGWSMLIRVPEASAMAGHEQNYNDTRIELDFNKNWKFDLTDDDSAHLKGYDDSAWETVNIPHDFSISQEFSDKDTGSSTGSLPGGTGWYRKWFNLYEYYSGDRIILNFDGVYQHAYVYVNGKYVGENHYGYNSFSFEISDYLICSNTALNLIAVKVVNDLPSSRWYSGSGINRDVTLTIAGPVHVSLYGPRITTPFIDTSDNKLTSEEGRITANIKIHNCSAIAKRLTVEATILDYNHNAVSGTEASQIVAIGPDMELSVELSPSISSPELWTLDNPKLYYLKTVVLDENGELIDEYHTTFGYRSIEWDATKGFKLNGQYIKLKGASLHHDQGALGAVQEYDSIYRQIVTLKEMGCNAIRTTHNPASKTLLNICNELGMLVIEEFFDGWDASKENNINDFSKYFNERLAPENKAIGANGQKWYEYVIEQTILRDEHNPCIIAWDVGNELCNITSGESTENYTAIAESIHNKCKELDPSRPILQGNNNPANEILTEIDSKMDIVGGNYSPAYWQWILKENNDTRSDKPFVSTEAASALSSRGVYYLMNRMPDAENEAPRDENNFRVTSYDTDWVNWGNSAAEAWYYVITNDWYSGEFIWTGFDYIGEPTPWNNYSNPQPGAVPNSSYFGVIDTAGFEKDSYFLYRSLWNEDSTTLHLLPGTWNKDNLYIENGYVNVAVYSNAAEIRLYLNGQQIASAKSTVNTTPADYQYLTWQESVIDSGKCNTNEFYTGNGKDFYSQFNVKYESGTLSVKAFDSNGNEIPDSVGTSNVTTSTATKIAAKVWQDQNTFVADGADYIYIEYEAQDANGNFVNDYNGPLNIKVDENSSRYAEIVGVDNGNPATTEKFQQSAVIAEDKSEANIKMFNGRALVILRTTEEEGTISISEVNADNDSLLIQGVTVSSVKETGIELTNEFEEVIRQNEIEYMPTLYDKYELTKYHISHLEPPEAGSSGSDEPENPGEEVIQDKFEIYLPDKAQTDACIENGFYALNVGSFLMSEEVYDGWAMNVATNCINVTEWAPTGSAYYYNSFTTQEDIIFEFIHQGENKYYIKSKSTGQYLYATYYSDGNKLLTLEDEPQLFTVSVNENQSVRICSEVSGTPYYVGCPWISSFFIHQENENNLDIWLYSAPVTTAPSEPSVPPSEVDENAPFEVYFADSSATDGVLKNGDYVISRGNLVMTDGLFDGWSINVSDSLSNATTASSSDGYFYESFTTGDENVFTFTHQGNNRYYIQNKNTKQYLCKNGWNLMYDTAPHLFTVQANADGSVLIYNEENGSPLYISRQWSYFEYIDKVNEFSTLWLYSKPYKQTSAEKTSLYDILHEGIEIDYSKYSRDSFEALIRALEEGVEVYKNPDSSNADYADATQKIRDAINALKIDIKKINGTLFKYGYNNSTGASDYSDGGMLMNNITVAKMKNAILSDSNLVRQIKDIIGYDTRTWAEGYADKALDEVAEIYAEIYSMQFTGIPYANYQSANKNAAINDPYPQYFYKDYPILSLWNVYTKDNTHGQNDLVLDYNGVMHEVHDGASVQGLAGSTLENGVITSHSAYKSPLSYANDGPDNENADITKYQYGLTTNGSDWWQVELQYLEGISVYFPDLFTRENLDADGNVTDATSGQFAKFYWDAKFPIFINTDEYGVNSYQFDSKDTKHLVQSDFDDENQTVKMELNEVDHWAVIGPNSGSGFFPFNYTKDTTVLENENAVYHYGFTFEHNFYIPKGGKHVNGDDVIFNFSGDDDVYVYIDGVLVLDNGGLHGAREVTINFTNCSINYQYAIDVADGQLKGDEYEVTYSYNDYFLNPDYPASKDYNADTIAALNKLHEVISDGQVHTLNFFYLERGASDSNCKMSFNLSETSEDVRIIDQEMTLDYGLPVEYNIQDNNDLSQAALDNGVQVEYLGICAINDEVDSTYTFELPEILVPFEPGITYSVDGMKYGDCTIDKEGNVKYSLKSMNMTESEHFYVCAKITGDPTYANDITYYQLERTTFIPATTIYYEDTYDSIIYTDGKVPENYNNDKNKYGLWQEDGTQPTTLKQSADLTDSEANPYGFETNYASFAEYSGGSIHFVDVSAKNNPNKKYSGGEGAEWPTVKFDFTGTGFDLISITDNTTGAFSVSVRDAETNIIVKNTVVNTFYGYNYGRLYADADGKPTLDDTLTPMYRSENGTCTSSERYYDENGAITDIPHYYDGDTVVDYVTENPAYAYAYGWIVAEDGTTETLYQIPVIKITDLEYGRYNVTVTPTFTSAFGHSSVNSDGTGYYRVYFDAIKIYSPAGTGDDIDDKIVKDAYSTDDELYPDYLELKDMLIGAESLSETESQGIIFIDGIAALDNDLEKYKNAGPNNELYLAKDQAVAFEIWATSVPTDIQLGAKLACGKPQLSISYAANTTPVDIRTAHDTFYSLNTVLPNESKLTWHLVTGADGNKYYTTGTVVIQNTGDDESILSVTNLKWTFSQFGGKGYFRIPTTVENEAVSVAATGDTPMLAYSLMRMRTADLSIEQTEEPEIITAENGSHIVAIKLNTSGDVDSLIITDGNGKEITPEDVKRIATELDGREVTQWIVTVKENEPGTHIYTVAGAYANGYTDYSKAVTVTVSVEAPPASDIPDEENTENETPDDTDTDSDAGTSVFDSIIGFFNRILEFFRALFALFGVNV